MEQVGELEVWDATEKFLNWLVKMGVDFEIEEQGGDVKVTIKNYKIGSYQGIIGLSAEFGGELI